MRLGALLSGDTAEEMAADAQRHRSAGFSSAWVTDGIGMEPLTVLSAVGRMVDGLELGTAVVRALPRHPMMLGQQALTVNAMIGGRLVLGVGPSHRPSVEQAWGIRWDRPIERMTDYLSVLVPLVREGRVSYSGETASARAEFSVAGASSCQVLVGALGPRMLDLAGRLADGTVTFQVGPATLRSFTAPRIIAAASRAGRPSPRIVAMVAVCVTPDVDAARERAARSAAVMAALPSYAAMLEREGGPALIAGTETGVAEQVARLEEAGVTDLIALRVARRGSVARRQARVRRRATDPGSPVAAGLALLRGVSAGATGAAPARRGPRGDRRGRSRRGSPSHAGEHRQEAGGVAVPVGAFDRG